VSQLVAILIVTLILENKACMIMWQAGLGRFCAFRDPFCSDNMPTRYMSVMHLYDCNVSITSCFLILLWLSLTTHNIIDKLSGDGFLLVEMGLERPLEQGSDHRDGWGPEQPFRREIRGNSVTCPCQFGIWSGLIP
jgi:hypothetical protein